MTDELKIALIQSDIHWENAEANLGMFEEKIWKLESRPDLIVLPEMFTTGFSMKAAELAEVAHTKTFRWMKQQAAQTKAVIMGSYILREGESFYNRLYVVYPDGSSQYYDKKHLFGLAGENAGYTAGTERLIVEVNGWKLMPLICYDLRFPVWARSRATKNSLYEYDALVYVANWPEPRIHAWDTLLAARAIENIAYCLGVNRLGTDGVGAQYVGHSAVYNFKGEVMAFSEKEENLTATLSAADLQSFRERFPFQQDADRFSFE